MNALGKWDTSNLYMMDLAFWAELLKCGNAFIDPECLAAFRVSPEAATAKLGHAQASSFRRFVHRVSGDPLYRVGKFDILSG